MSGNVVVHVRTTELQHSGLDGPAQTRGSSNSVGRRRTAGRGSNESTGFLRGSDSDALVARFGIVAADFAHKAPTRLRGVYLSVGIDTPIRHGPHDDKSHDGVLRAVPISSLTVSTVFARADACRRGGRGGQIRVVLNRCNRSRVRLVF